MLATALAVAITARLVLDLPWEIAFVIGAALAPTDPVAATSIIRGLGAPERVSAILEGESLVNDGTGLSVLQVALGTVGAASFALGSAALEFVGVVLGGIAVGGAVGWIASMVRSRLEQPDVEIAISVLTAYGSFLAGDRLGVSGILAAVVAGLVMGMRSPREVRPSTRMRAICVLGAAAVLRRVDAVPADRAAVRRCPRRRGRDRPRHADCGDARGRRWSRSASGWLWVLSTPYFAALPRALRSGSWRPRPLLSPRELVLVAGGGMRGAVSVAAVLSIPVTVAGEPFPDRGKAAVRGLRGGGASRWSSPRWAWAR